MYFIEYSIKTEWHFYYKRMIEVESTLSRFLQTEL